MRGAVGVGIAIIALSALIAVPSRAASVTVADSDTGGTFTPKTVMINVGGTVTWSYALSGKSVHSVTSDDGSSFDKPQMAPGTSFEHTFSEPGTFAYHCSYHQTTGMTGTVIVRAASSAPSSTPTHTATAAPRQTSTAAAPPGTTATTPGASSSATPLATFSQTVPATSSPEPCEPPSCAPLVARPKDGGSSAAVPIGIGVGVALIAAGLFLPARRRRG